MKSDNTKTAEVIDAEVQNIEPLKPKSNVNKLFDSVEKMSTDAAHSDVKKVEE